MLNHESKITNLQSRVTSARRRSWFVRCTQLGIDDDTQRVIAADLIPLNRKGRINSRGEISRSPIFHDDKIWQAANRHLMSLEKNRRSNHKRLDGKPSGARISDRQYNYILYLANQVSWNNADDQDDVIHNVERLAARLSGSKSPKIVKDLRQLSSKEARNLIQSLINMVDNNAA